MILRLLINSVSIPENLSEMLDRMQAHMERMADPMPWTITSVTIAVAALVVSAVGVRYSYLAAKYSRETAENVHRINNNIQIKLLQDLIRHLYRNKVCALAMEANMEKAGYRKYPAEGHLLKLKTLPGDIHLEQYNADVDNYARMHQLALLLRNYNTEIDVAKEHLCNPDIPEEVKKKDMGNLLFKPFYLTYHIIEAIERLRGDNSTESAVRILLGEHFSKLAENSDRSRWAAESGAPEAVTDKSLNDLLKKIREESPVVRAVDVLSVDNEYITGKLRNMLREGNIVPEFAEIMNAETGSRSEWNAAELLPVALATDVLVEIPKIGMIEYPQK